MLTPENAFKLIKTKVGEVGWSSFLSTLLFGVFVHMPILTSDIPNHDGLASMYFDQNMLTSGRWFLGIACGISSYYSLPWLIGIISLVYLAVTSIFVCRLLNINNKTIAVLIGMLLTTFPSMASYFAYVFTMDGYMLGVLFAVLAVYFVDRYRLGFLFGGLFLALSLGIYQAYLPITIFLSVCLVFYKIINCGLTKKTVRFALNYLYMGLIGGIFYYFILKILLMINGESLNTYQGINSMMGAEKQGILYTIKCMYQDFFAFSFRGHIIFSNVYAMIATVVLVVIFGASYVAYVHHKGLNKAIAYIGIIIVVLLIPFINNIILLVSPNVTYHLLMRYQWIFIEIMMLAFVSNAIEALPQNFVCEWIYWASFISAVVIGFSFVLTDNIAYSNMQKKYEKTYAYCLRLADRIEQTDGYYEGIPIYLIGVVSDEQYPLTDITENVTGNIIGASGDYLLYSSVNYEQFFKNYLGITFNIVDTKDYNFYYEDWYVNAPSFPAKESICIKDGILVVKTENVNR